MKPEITLIKKCGPNPVMSKRIFLDAQGKVCSDGSQCSMAQGTATRATAETAADLAKHIMACGTEQAIALGALRADLANPAEITTLAKLKDDLGAIPRSRDFIDYRPGAPAWALIDFDTKGMPLNVAAGIEAAGGMWNALLTFAPGLQRAARVSRASTSSGLYRSDTGTQFDGSGGAHHYILVKDGSDIERFLRDLHDRCWQRGLGWHLIGRAGQLLDRSLVDRMVAYGERLCFEGAPVIESPLAQDVTKRTPNVFEGEAIDTELVVPRLTEYERERVKEAKAASTEALGRAALEIRAQHDRTLAERISTKSGLPIISASRLVAARHRGVLLPHLDLDFDHLGMVSVAAVLADPDRFIGALLAMTDMEADEHADFVATVAKKAGSGVQAVKARIAKERREREKAKRKTAMASGGDGRLIRPRPEFDGELLPTTKFLDEVLASDRREEPPMRDASGNLVEVRVQEPWALHLLTADGTNAGLEDAEIMKAPAEPALVRHTATGVKKNHSYPGSLPGPFEDLYIGSIHFFAHVCRPIRPPNRMFGTRSFFCSMSG